MDWAKCHAGPSDGGTGRREKVKVKANHRGLRALQGEKCRSGSEKKYAHKYCMVRNLSHGESYLALQVAGI
eukprot:6174012-Pleurochrysis_carterae.AAC.1